MILLSLLLHWERGDATLCVFTWNSIWRCCMISQKTSHTEYTPVHIQLEAPSTTSKGYTGHRSFLFLSFSRVLSSKADLSRWFSHGLNVNSWLGFSCVALQILLSSLQFTYVSALNSDFIQEPRVRTWKHLPTTKGEKLEIKVNVTSLYSVIHGPSIRFHVW